MRKTTFFIAMMLGIFAMNTKADTYKIYALNKVSEWTELQLYAWGDEECFGPWGGKSVDGKATINDVEWVYFEFSDALVGKTEHLMFHSGDAKLETEDLVVTLEAKDYYVEVAQPVAKFVDPSGNPLIDPKQEEQITVRAHKPAEWDKIFIWAWTDSENFTGGQWPGVEMTDNGDGWFCFNVPAGASVIFSNNGTPQTANIDNVDGTKGYLVAADGNYEETTENVPTTECSSEVIKPEEKDVNFIVKVTKPDQWDKIFIYIWGGGEVFGAWPGAEMAQDGSWFRIEVASKSENNNIIFNNGNGGEGNQVDAPNNPWAVDACFNISNELACSVAECSTALMNVSEAGVSVYPTVVSNQFTVEAQEVITNVSVFSLAGQQVATRSASSKSVVMNAADFASGMYIVRVLTADGKMSIQNIIK
mgnify:CR=1 FL=1